MPKHFCSNPCHADKEAEIYCTKCEKYYCIECEVGIHETFFSEHADFVIQDIGDGDIFTGKCETHKDYPLDYFCNDHKRLCCAKCRSEIGAHTKCDVVPFESLNCISEEKKTHNVGERPRRRASQSRKVLRGGDREKSSEL